MAEKGYKMKEDAGRGWRRVVAAGSISGNPTVSF
jgi:carbamate kinase